MLARPRNQQNISDLFTVVQRFFEFLFVKRKRRQGGEHAGHVGVVVPVAAAQDGGGWRELKSHLKLAAEKEQKYTSLTLLVVIPGFHRLIVLFEGKSEIEHSVCNLWALDSMTLHPDFQS